MGDGSGTTIKYDGTVGCKNVGDPGCVGHLTSITTTNKDGLREIKNCDRAGNCTNVYDRALSSNEKKTAHPRIEGPRPGAAPQTRSVTQKVQADALKKVNDKVQGQDVMTGGKTKLNVRGSDLTTMQKSQLGGSSTQRLQTGFSQQIKSIPRVQNWGSSSVPAGSGAQRYHRPH